MVRLRLLPVFLLSALLPALAAGADLQTLSGKKYSGELVSLGPTGVVIRIGDHEQSVPLSDVLLLDLQPAPPLPPANPAVRVIEVELTDGSLFHCSNVNFKGKQAELSVTAGMTVKVPIAALSSVFTEAQDPTLRPQWEGLTARRGTRDRLASRQDDRIITLEGTIGDASDDGSEIEFERAGSGAKRGYPIDSLVGMIFVQRLQGDVAETLCRVTDAQRNQVVCQKAFLSGEGLTLTTLAGAVVKYADTKPIVQFDFSKGKVVYLWDLKPAVEEFEALDEMRRPFTKAQRDRVIESGKPKLEGREFEKGLTLRPGNDLVFDLGGEYKEFKTVIGVDDSVASRSQSEPTFVADNELTVEVDGKVVFKHVVHRQDKPKAITLDVHGGRKLRITVAADPYRFPVDPMTLADAKVTK